MRNLGRIVCISLFFLVLFGNIVSAAGKPVQMAPGTGVDTLLEVHEMVDKDGLKDLMRNETFQTLKTIAKSAATLLFLFAIISKMVNPGIGEERPGYQWLIPRLVLVAVAFAGYDFIYTQIWDLTNAAIDSINGRNFYIDIATYYAGGSEALMLQAIHAGGEGAARASGPLAIIGMLLKAPFWVMISEAVALISETVYGFFLIYRAVWLTFLFIFGPLALASFINPGMSRLGWGWLENFINALLWPLWMGIIMKVQMHLVGLDATGFGDPKITLLANVFSIVLVIQIPTLLPRIVRGVGIKR